MSTKNDIVHLLKHEILTLSLKPGTILSETALSEQFQISRTPLRDCLKQLALESYIDIYPKKGNVVSYIDLESVEQIIYLRSVLEKDIMKGLLGGLSLKGQLELTKIVDQQKHAISQPDALETFLLLDDSFHRTLFKLAGHEFLWNLLKLSNVHYERYRRLHMLKQAKLEAILREHQLMLESIIKQDMHHSIDELINHHLREDINSVYLQENFAEYIKD